MAKQNQFFQIREQISQDHLEQSHLIKTAVKYEGLITILARTNQSIMEVIKVLGNCQYKY